MDYQEEQEGEIEALRAIYSEELTEISEDPYCFDIDIQADNEDTRDENKVKVSGMLRFTYTPKYPDEAPLMEINEPSEHLTELRIETLLSELNEQALENAGMVMVFTLVSFALERFNDFVDDVKAEIKAEENRAKLEQQKLDEIKYKGTPVTLENFLAWKISFDAEMISLGKRTIESTIKSKKLTGKQLFERDATLNESDIQFLTDSGVKVDESLFQDLDDLDLDEELEGLDD